MRRTPRPGGGSDAVAPLRASDGPVRRPRSGEGNGLVTSKHSSIESSRASTPTAGREAAARPGAVARNPAPRRADVRRGSPKRCSDIVCDDRAGLCSTRSPSEACAEDRRSSESDALGLRVHAPRPDKKGWRARSTSDGTWRRPWTRRASNESRDPIGHVRRVARLGSPSPGQDRTRCPFMHACGGAARHGHVHAGRRLRRRRVGRAGAARLARSTTWTSRARTTSSPPVWSRITRSTASAAPTSRTSSTSRTTTSTPRSSSSSRTTARRR